MTAGTIPTASAGWERATMASEHATAIATAASRAFRAMRAQAEGGKTRFGDQVSRLARALEVPMRAAMATALGREKAVAAADDAHVWLRQQSMEAAAQVLSTSRERLEAGAEPRDVFSVDRAALVGADQADRVLGAAKVFVAKSRGKKLRWKTDGKPCADCRSLSGRVVKPGDDFVAKSGARVKHSPLHPNCNCKVEEV